MLKNYYPGKFIVLEGLDGAGKSTQVPLILDHFKNEGVKIHSTSEPSQFLTGAIVRSRLLDEWQSSAACLQLLFAADRAQHLEKEIIPKLKDGITVICDRYLMSSVAYGAIESDFDWLAQINSRFLAPDLTIYLDVPAQTCVNRIISNGKSLELFEHVAILEKVAQNYKKAMDVFGAEMKIEVVDGNRAPADVFGDMNKSFKKNII